MTDHTDHTADTSEADTVSAVAAVDSPDEQADLADDLTPTDEKDDLAGLGKGSAGSRVPGTGALSGGFGFAGLALAVVSLTTNWTSGIMVSHDQYREEMNASSSGLPPQQQLDLAVSGWHVQGWWALGFAAAAVLCGVGASLLPAILRRGGTPGWAKASATGAVVVGLVGVVLGVLTIVGVIGGQLTAPAG